MRTTALEQWPELSMTSCQPSPLERMIALLSLKWLAHLPQCAFLTPETWAFLENINSNICNNSTSTTTVTATSTVTGMTVSKRNGELVLRTTFETPSTVPTYASVCPNTSAYLSACSCWGISPITIVLPTPTTVTTTTSTTTVTSTAFSTPWGNILMALSVKRGNLKFFPELETWSSLPLCRDI